uniref:HTH CENPB-type domain-containing protein n=1 Tax=Ditylenchus dipsaci TaxID=166011 RepID=A0A915D1Q4_9BILA
MMRGGSCTGDYMGAMKRRRNVETATKLEAIEWARRYSNHSAASKFNVTRSRIKDWKKKEDELRCQVKNTARGSKRKRLDGGGRYVSNPELDVELAEWVRIKRENKQPVSRQIITNKATELFRIGWLVELFPASTSFRLPPSHNNCTEAARELRRSCRQIYRPLGAKKEGCQV